MSCAIPSLVEELQASGQIALVYTRPDGSPALGAYPHNPNGSILDIAGMCNPAGNVLGLMPHPEDHVLAFQHPGWSRNRAEARQFWPAGLPKWRPVCPGIIGELIHDRFRNADSPGARRLCEQPLCPWPTPIPGKCAIGTTCRQAAA